MARNDTDIAIDAAFDDAQAFDTAGAERSLLAAVLLTAVADLKRTGDPNRKAVEFFLSNEEDYVFSFRGICHFLNLDPDQVLVVTGLRRRHLGEPVREVTN